MSNDTTNYKRKAILGAVGLAICMAFCGFSYTGIVVIRSPLCASFGYDEALFSIFFSTYCAGCMVGNLMLGKLIERFGVKKVAIVGSFGPIFGFAMLVFVPNLYVAWVVGFVMGYLITLTSFVTTNIFVSSWFSEGQGTMMSIGGIMLNALSIVGSPILATLMSSIPLLPLSLGIGGVFTGISLIATLFLVCGLPADYGCGQVSIASKKAEAADSAEAAPAASAGYDPVMPTAKLILVPQTLAALVAPVLLTIGVTAYATNPLQVYETFGLDAVQGSLCMSVTAIAGIVVLAVFGMLNDRVGTRKSILVFTGLAIAMLMVAYMLTGWVGAIIAAIFTFFVQYTNMYGGLVMPTVAGPTRAPEFMGYVGMLQGGAGIFAPIVAVAVYNMTGTWRSLIPLCIVLYVASLAMIMFALGKGTQDALRKADAPYVAKQGE